MNKQSWRFILHSANAVAWLATLETCPVGQRGSRCALHAAIALGIELWQIA